MTIYDAIGDAYDLVYPDTSERVPFVKDLLKRLGKDSVLELGIGTGFSPYRCKRPDLTSRGWKSVR